MRSRIAHLSKSKALLVTLVAVIVAAVGGTTVGYAALNKSVTLSLDGQAQTVSAMGGTVGDVLSGQGIEVTDKDLVAPALDEPIEDGTRISVQFGRTAVARGRRRGDDLLGQLHHRRVRAWARSAAASRAPTSPPAAARRSVAPA